MLRSCRVVLPTQVEFDAAEFDFDAEDWDEVGEGGEGENEDNDEGEDEDEDEDAQAREAADDSGLPKQLEAEESFLDQDVTQFDKEFADYLSQGAARMATAPDPPLAQEPPQFVDISRDVEGDRSTPSNSPGSRDTKGAPSIVDSSGRKRLGTVTGVCTRWLNVRGYGFVETEDGNTDVFVHQSSIISEGFRSLQVGEKVRSLCMLFVSVFVRLETLRQQKKCTRARSSCQTTRTDCEQNWVFS